MSSPQQAISNATESLKRLGAQSKVKIIIYAMAGIVVLTGIGMLIFWYVNRTINNRKGFRFPLTETPILATEITTLTADKVPNSFNGKRQTISFWIYIHDIDKYSGEYRHVWHRGDRSDRFDKASPAVYLDKDTNKLIITFGTEKADAYEGIQFGSDVDDDAKYRIIQRLRGVTLNYIPIQRWVHVAIVVNEEVNNGIITAYLDGELVTIVSSDKMALMNVGTNTPAEVRLSLHNTNLDKKGNIFVGGSPSDEIGPGFSGLVSRIAFFNYDMNAKDIYKEYKKGPVNGFPGKLGYGVRTPVYRLG
jgi:hypothetical protein